MRVNIVGSKKAMAIAIKNDTLSKRNTMFGLPDPERFTKPTWNRKRNQHTDKDQGRIWDADAHALLFHMGGIKMPEICFYEPWTYQLALPEKIEADFRRLTKKKRISYEADHCSQI